MLLVVGLGNPGPGYAGNRHNVGAMVVEEIVRQHRFSAYRKRFRGDLAEGNLAGEKILVLRPSTYMNESGVSVQGAMAFYKIPPEDIIVVHDELDLVPGKVRVKLGGGHGGHNGLRDITHHIGANFRRVRVGIGHPGDKHLVEGYVLRDFFKEERPMIDKVVDAVAANFALLIEDRASNFMSRVADAVHPPRPKPPRKPPEGEAAEKEKPEGDAPDGEAPKGEAPVGEAPVDDGRAKGSDGL